MKKSVAIAASAIVAIAFAANQVECGAEEQEQVSDQKVKKASQDSQNKVFRLKLLEIAKVYEGYGRVDDETRWAPYLCRMPMPSIARLSQINVKDCAANLISVLQILLEPNKISFIT